VIFRPTTVIAGVLSLVNDILATLYRILNAEGGLFVLEELGNILLTSECNAKVVEMVSINYSCKKIHGILVGYVIWCPR
jgi:hypothetical protein